MGNSTSSENTNPAKMCIAGGAGVGKTVLFKALQWSSQVSSGQKHIKLEVEETLNDQGLTELSLVKPENDEHGELDELQTLFEQLTVARPTVIDLAELKLKHGDKTLSVTIVDTAGQKDYSEINNVQFVDCEMFILVISAVDQSSIDECSYFIDSIRDSKKGQGKKSKSPKNEKLGIVFVRTKIDMIGKMYSGDKEPNKEKVSEKEIELMASTKGIKNFSIVSCSGLVGTNLDQMTRLIIEMNQKISTKQKGKSGKSK